MATKEPLDDVEINSFSVAVPLDCSMFDTYDELSLQLVETVAESIVANVDDLDEGDTSYVTTQVSFNEDDLEDVYHDDEVGITTVETVTELAIVDDEDDNE